MSNKLRIKKTASGKPLDFSKPLKPQLSIHDLSLFAYIGSTSEERATPQEISLSIKMEFPLSPSAEITDNLEDTLCYKEVCEMLKEFIKSNPFHLIEKMAKECFAFLKNSYPSMRIRLTLHKKHPPIEGLKGGVEYTCGDAF